MTKKREDVGALLVKHLKRAKEDMPTAKKSKTNRNIGTLLVNIAIDKSSLAKFNKELTALEIRVRKLRGLARSSVLDKRVRKVRERSRS